MAIARLAIERAERIEKPPLRLRGLDGHNAVEEIRDARRARSRHEPFGQVVEHLAARFVEDARSALLRRARLGDRTLRRGRVRMRFLGREPRRRHGSRHAGGQRRQHVAAAHFLLIVRHRRKL